MPVLFKLIVDKTLRRSFGKGGVILARGIGHGGYRVNGDLNGVAVAVFGGLSHLVFCVFVHIFHERKKRLTGLVTAIVRRNVEIAREYIEAHLHAALIALGAALVAAGAEKLQIFVGENAVIYRVKAASDVGFGIEDDRRLLGLIAAAAAAKKPRAHRNGEDKAQYSGQFKLHNMDPFCSIKHRY